MNSVYVSVIFALAVCAYGNPFGNRKNPLQSFSQDNEAYQTAFDQWVENAVDENFGQLWSDAQFDDSGNPVIEEVEKLIADVKNVSQELVSKIRTKVIQIVKDYKWQILIKITFKDFEGLKKLVREITKKVIVAIDDEVIKVLIGDGYDEKAWLEVVEKWNNLPNIPTVKEIEQLILSYLKDFLVGVVEDIFEKLIGLLGKLEDNSNEYWIQDLIVGKLRAIAEKVVSGMEDILGDVLQDRPFVVKELKRYKPALEIFGKRAAVIGVKLPARYEDILNAIQKYITGHFGL